MRPVLATVAGCCATVLIVSLAFTKERRAPSLTEFSPGGIGGTYYDYDNSIAPINESIKRLKSPVERSAIQEIISELKNRPYRELVELKLATDVCQEVACRGAPPDLVIQYVQANLEVLTYENLARNAAAAESSSAAAQRSFWISVISAAVATLSLMVAFASFWRSRRV